MAGEKMDTNSYRSEMQRAMKMLSEDPRVVFLGQTVAYPGSRFTYDTFSEVPMTQRVEMPIMEDTQMGISIGLAMAGLVPVSVYPRLDFLLLATNQMANHLDKLEELSDGRITPKVIVRSVVGARKPIYPGPQHCQDHTDAFKLILPNMNVVKLENSREIVPAYRHALYGTNKSSLLIDVGNAHYG